MTNPLGGTYTVSLSTAISKLNAPPAQGGAGISFAAGSPGTAVVSLNADNQIHLIATPTVETLTYSYDANKNPTSETRSGVMAPYSWTTGPAGYDNEDRLTSWNRTNGDSQTWSLSPVHDWTSTVINGSTQTRIHGPAHEILTMAGAGVTPTPATLQHDVKGNMTLDDRGTGMAWDFDNMLQTFSANGVTGLSNATYEYDAMGRRVAKNVAETGGTKTTLFVQAGQQVTCEYSPGNAVTDCDRKYAYGTYIDEVLSFVDATAASEVRYWLHQNRQYSVYATTATAGTVAERLRYDAYGAQFAHAAGGMQLAAETPTIQSATFTGRVRDAESTCVQFRSRLYTPSCGRFCSRDDIGYHDGNNLLSAYFSLRFVDPSGHEICGIYAWLYAGAWCVPDDVYQAAIEAAGQVVSCWWNCEVTTHQRVLEYVGGALVNSGSWILLERVRTILKTPGQQLPGAQVATSILSACAHHMRKTCVGNMLRSHMRYLKSFPLKGACRTGLIGVVITETVIGLNCAWTCRNG